MDDEKEYPGPERRRTAIKLESRVRMLEELERAGNKSREGMHRQISELKSDQQAGFKEVAEAINNLSMEVSTTKGSCPVGEEPCPKGDIPWLKQWLTWIGAGEVAIISFIGYWLVTH